MSEPTSTVMDSLNPTVLIETLRLPRVWPPRESRDRSGRFHTQESNSIDMSDRLSGSFTGVIVTDRRGQLLTCISG
jgi:hypothetical protein